MNTVKFIGLTDFGFGPVARFFRAHGKELRLDEKSLRLRIENLKNAGNDASEEMYALGKMLES